MPRKTATPKVTAAVRIQLQMRNLVDAYPDAVAQALCRTDAINALTTGLLRYAHDDPEGMEGPLTLLLDDPRPGVRRTAQGGLTAVERARAKRVDRSQKEEQGEEI
jgi:hypothetical protein